MDEHERVNYENTVAAFTALMLKKLRENDHKTHWRNESVVDLFRMLDSEVRELEAELTSERTSPVKIARECADIANFCLMISDVMGGLDEELPKRETVTIELLQKEVLRLRDQVVHENARWRDVSTRYDVERDCRMNLERLLQQERSRAEVVAQVE